MSTPPSNTAETPFVRSVTGRTRLRRLSARTWMVCGALALAAAFALAVITRAALYEYSSTHRAPRPLDIKASQTGIEGLRDVSFESAPGLTISAWLAPSRNGAAIIFGHGSDANRAQLLPEAKLLAQAGFGILALDWPGQGKSGGRTQWGPAERRALHASVDFLLQQPSVQGGRIGAFGFSLGGYYVAQAAAVDPRLRAVALASTPASLDELIRWEHRRWGSLSEEPGLLAAHWLNGVQDEHTAEQRVPGISPRPLLMVEGSLDQVVPRQMTERLFLAASEPKTRLIVEGAGHGDFAHVAPEVYGARLREFFAQALLGASFHEPSAQR